MLLHMKKNFVGRKKRQNEKRKKKKGLKLKAEKNENMWNLYGNLKLKKTT